MANITSYICHCSTNRRCMQSLIKAPGVLLATARAMNNGKKQ